MPKVSEQSVADRKTGHTNTHPVGMGGDVMLLPSDIQLGEGNFTKIDQRTNDPVGYPLGHIENPDGVNIYIGTSPDDVHKQNGPPLPPDRASFVASQLLDLNAAKPPNPNSPFLAQLPQPEAPLIKKIAAPQLGYPASTTSTPYWVCLAYVDEAGFITTGGPSAPFQLANGQGARVTLYDTMPDGVYKLAIFMSEPGKSTASSTGTMYLQRIVDRRTYRLPYYDLLGPYRWDKKLPTSNETMLPNAPAPTWEWASGKDTIGGFMQFFVTWTNNRGETAGVNYLNVSLSSVVYSGRYIKIKRPTPPPGATGWYLYCIKQELPEQGGKSVTGRVYDRRTRTGDLKPWPISTTYVLSSGDVTVAVDKPDPTDIGGSGGIPNQNTTALAPPDSDIDVPFPTGAAYPPPGRYYAKTTDTVGTRETIPSKPTYADVGTGEIMRIVPVRATNRLPNGDFRELDSLGMPLDWYASDDSGNPSNAGVGTITVDGSDVVLNTGASTTSMVKSLSSDRIVIDRTKAWHSWTNFTAMLPNSGAVAGTFQVWMAMVNAAGTITWTQLGPNVSSIGDYDYQYVINAVGGSAPAWLSDTVYAFFWFGFTGTNRNMRVKIHWSIMKDHTHTFRMVNPPSYSPTSSPDPPKIPPGGQTIVSPPPENIPPPVLSSFQAPNRPLVNGTVSQSLTFDTGLPGGIWSSSVAGGGSVAASATAAISGAQGLRIQKAAAGALAQAKYQANEGAKSNDAIFAQIKPGALPAGKVVLNGLGRYTDNNLFAWTEMGSTPEIAQLTVNSPPTDPGSISVEPEGAPATIAMTAIKEVNTWTISTAPTGFGTITLGMGGATFNVQAGGTAQVEQLTVQRPRFNGLLQITLGGVTFPVQCYISDSATKLAQRIRATAFAGWTTSGSSNVVNFTATAPGPRTAPTVNPSTSATPSTIKTVTAGTLETATQLADRVRAMIFNGWSVSGSGATVLFTSTTAGDKGAPTISWGTTGGAGSFTTTTGGAQDDTVAVATKIAAATFTGWTVTRSGSTVTFTSTTSGVRQDLRFNDGGTGVRVSVVTTQQGINADLSAVFRDSQGNIRRRRIMSSIAVGTTYNIDITVNGAGTSHATVTFWASIGAAARTVVADWENVDLSSHTAGYKFLGVDSENTAGATWDIYIDNVDITDGGKSKYERFDPFGNLLNQIGHYGPPTMPVRDDLLIQGENGEGRRDPVIPGNTYRYGARIYWKNIPASTPAFPLFVRAYFEDGNFEDLGGIAGGSSGITGSSSGWQDLALAFTARNDPDKKAVEVRLKSYRLGVGEIVIQQIALSQGTSVDRSQKFAASGTYSSRMNIGTPNKPKFVKWSQRRRNLSNVVETPTGTTATSTYGSATTQAGLNSATMITDPTLVTDNTYLRVDTAMTPSTDRYSSPVIRSDSPLVETDFVLGTRPEATLLDERGRELDGGTIFAKLQEPDHIPEIAMQIRPGNVLDPHIISKRVGQLLASELHVFTPEARDKIANNWWELFCIEAFGMRYLVRFSAPIEFERKSPFIYDQAYGGKTFAWYTGKLPGGQIVAEVDLS